MRNAYVLVTAVLLVVGVVAFYPGGGPAPLEHAGGPAVLGGAPAASFSIKNLAGASDGLDRYRGHVVVMNLWASWCGPCRAEMPDLQRLSKAFAGRGLVVLGIDEGESAAVAGAFARSRGVTFPILLDTEQQYGRAYAAVGLPTTIIVGRDGRVVRGVDGAMSYAQMQAAAAAALAR